MYATGTDDVDDGGDIRHPLPAAEGRGSGRPEGPAAAVSAVRTTPDR
ncbi:hypothetical protein [Halorubrum sp. BV1]|nr:hypothetical protein [Halorubrum sp. BV1]